MTEQSGAVLEQSVASWKKSLEGHPLHVAAVAWGTKVGKVMQRATQGFKASAQHDFDAPLASVRLKALPSSGLLRLATPQVGRAKRPSWRCRLSRKWCRTGRGDTVVMGASMRSRSLPVAWSSLSLVLPSPIQKMLTALNEIYWPPLAYATANLVAVRIMCLASHQHYT